MVCAWQLRRVNRDDVALFEYLFHLNLPHADRNHTLRAYTGIGRDDVHLERLQQLREMSAGISKADNADGQVEQILYTLRPENARVHLVV